MEENKSPHTCTNKGGWMLYPWLPPHATYIIFITKTFAAALLALSPDSVRTGVKLGHGDAVSLSVKSRGKQKS